MAWCIAKVTPDFVWRMEDVLDLYAEPYDEKQPVVCFDEKPYQLLAKITPDLPTEPGRPRREDYEYKRMGTCNLFIAFEPHTGQREVEVTERRGNAEFAQQMQQLVARYPHAQVIRVVLDNLSTHSPAALYQTLPPEEARELVKKLEFHFTPKHGRWLNMRAGACWRPFCPRRPRSSGRRSNASA